MESYSIIVCVFGIICLLLLGVIYFVNRILQYKIRIDNSFLVVSEIIEDRVSIIDNMILFLEKFLEHEKSYLKKLEQTKNKLLSIKNNKDGILTLKSLDGDIFSFCKLDDTYNKLVKNRDFLKLKEEILKNNERLVYAMDSYDKGVINYNNYTKNKFIYLLGKLCGNPDYSCYNK